MCFFLVDAFTDTIFKGNPAGVMVVDDFGPQKKMQEIANFFGFTDLAFIKHVSDNQFAIKWFSPLDESPICGHATIAASHVVFSTILTECNIIYFSYANGVISSINSSDEYTIAFPKLVMQPAHPKCVNIKKLISLDNYEAIYEDQYTYMIVLRNARDIFNVQANFGAIRELEKRALILTSPGFENFDFCVRYFAPKVEVYEDPVCGSANCRASLYWAERYQKKKLVSFQASKRTGIIRITVDEKYVMISGKAATVCKFSHYKFD